MKESRLLYNILDVAVDATLDEIKEAFRNKAQVHHPDKGGEASVFFEILEAYRILSDPEKREKYDKTGYSGENESDDKEVCMEVLKTLFTSVLSNHNILKIDIPTQLVSMVMNAIDGFKKSKVQGAKRIKDYETVRGRLKYKKESDIDILDIVIVTEIKKLKSHQIFLDYQLKIYGMIIDVISNYTYNTPKKRA